MKFTMPSFMIYLNSSNKIKKIANYIYEMNMNKNNNIEVALFALPLLFMCILTQLAYYPAQMSSDSVDQWWQITEGIYGDSHPITSTLINKLFYIIIPSPAFVVAVQYFIFCLSIGLLISNIKHSGVNLFGCILLSVLMALYAPNYLVSTTLWKDVPFTTGLILTTCAIFNFYNNDNKFSNTYIIILYIGLSLVLLTRHNGILICLPVLLAISIIADKKFKKTIYLISLTLLSSYAVLKVIINPYLGVIPIDRYYNTIFALPLLGAMVNNDEILDQSTHKMVESIMPIDSWKSSYDCKSVVPIFWNEKIDRNYLRENTLKINTTALTWITMHPMSFAKHQFCMTGILWNPLASKGEWVGISPHGVTQFKLSERLNLSTNSKLPLVKSWLDNKISPKFEINSAWNRPSTLLWLGILSISLLAIMKGHKVYILILPMVLNMATLIPLIGSQDFRYMWPSAVIGIAITFYSLWIITSLLIGKYIRQPQ